MYLNTGNIKFIPHLRETPNGTQIFLHDRPRLLLAGQVHNSSFSSAKYMSTVWEDLKAHSINTVLGPVTWEAIEPVEGKFDFTELDKVMADAGKHHILLVILWFGSYKNGLSTYAPHWVKRDVDRFPRVHIWDADRGEKRTLEMISPFCEEGWRADAKAFAMLMKHIEAFDSGSVRVLMVQVQNETGLLGDSRDRSVLAEKAFAEGIPSELLKHLSKSKRLHPRFIERYGKRIAEIDPTEKHSWPSIFGPRKSADEAFMAHYISKYVGHVAAAGKEVYPIPFYTNTWLHFDDPSALDLDGYPVVVGGGAGPGIYPSGGPCPHVMVIWR